MEIECIGRLTTKGNIAVNPSVLANIRVGSKLNIKVTVTEGLIVPKERKKLSPAAKRLLTRMRNAQNIGAPLASEELSHSRLLAERMEEKFPWPE